MDSEPAKGRGPPQSIGLRLEPEARAINTTPQRLHVRRDRFRSFHSMSQKPSAPQALEDEHYRRFEAAKGI